MTTTNTLAVVGAMLMAIAFLVLGGELLRPHGLVPDESRTAPTLGRLLGDVWGPIGYWFMIAAIVITFCSTTLAVQDGFGRMFSDGLDILFGARDEHGHALGNRERAHDDHKPSSNHRLRWSDRPRLKRHFTIVVLGILPAALYAIVGNPVSLLKLAGAIEAAHIPLVTGLALYANRIALPAALQPSRFAFSATLIAGLFFAAFAVLYPLELLR